MKKMQIYILTMSLFALTITSCKEDAKNENEDFTTIFSDILEDFTDKTVIATYSAMADNAILLKNEVEKLEGTVTNEQVSNAAQAWVNTRQYWERSEAFLFGPAAFNNLDPLLDSWPLDKNQLDQVLADVEADKIEMSAAYVRENLGASLRGFHAVEYLLFRDGNARNGADITPSELIYLKAVAQVLTEDCIALEAWWTGTENLTTEKQGILEDAEIETAEPFGNEMKNAGQAGSRYSSLYAAIEEIIQGAMDIADEVGNAKIADPVESGNVLDVESWYSWNSLDDFQNNIRSIENVYLGGLDENNRGVGLSAFVKSKDAALDTEIQSNIENALTTIAAIGTPFRNNLNNKTGTDAAIAACGELFDSLKKIKNLL